MLDIDKLTTPAKAEAMRVGHTAVINNDEILSFMDSLTPYLLDGETFSVKPLGTLVGTIKMYSIRITPVLKLKPIR